MNSDPTSLDRLHDILAPPAAPWWPPAPGWIVVGSVLIIAAGIAAVRAFHAWQQNCYRREALRDLRRLEAQTSIASDHNVAASIAAVVKRVALTVWPREQVASLTGAALWQFLDRATTESHIFEQAGPTLDRAVYDDRFAGSLTPAQLQQLFTAARQWIKQHTRGPAQC